MSIALKTSTALSACSVCVSQTHMAYEVGPMSIALKTSTALRLCVPDTHGLRGRADVDRAQGLDGAASTQCLGAGRPRVSLPQVMRLLCLQRVTYLL